ncbi:diadenylate cyclase [Halopiger aswanensis]|uniref:DisA checkpoint controller-like protein n=1 Tax=Halopiger aswanensis TaxID=148449 RepID=A0A419WI38_9EURY|nr:diadenylate cyclase [Halopiger aswanensis]RKD95095.1 DisA checkpoint controller-like protein [Halopiger aswanensis]
MGSELRIPYEDHDGVRELTDCLRYTLEGISLSFDRWNEEFVKGPGLYVAVVTGPSIERFADPMGGNEWPVDRCRSVCLDLQNFFETTSDVARSRDGAVVVSVDGVVQRRMVRFADPVPDECDDLAPQRTEYEDWMGSRHMSALDTSRRANVVATLTLSEETGRVSVFENGTMETAERRALGGEWNVERY